VSLKVKVKIIATTAYKKNSFKISANLYIQLICIYIHMFTILHIYIYKYTYRYYLLIYA